MAATVHFSVAICTYNGANRIPEVLDQLQKQVGTEGIDWEVVVVDNNSSDRTKEVVEGYARSWRQDSQLKYVFEPKQGVFYARIKAVESAQSDDLIGFLDDDNLPAENWVAEAYRFGQENPKVGAYGGIIHAKLDEPPPPYFEQVKVYLTIFNRGETAFCYQRAAKIRRIPPAPGVVIRKQTWKETIPPSERLLVAGRDEKTMAAGEDAEMMFYIQNSNWEVWHNPKMEIWHHIPSHRLEKNYLLKLARGYGFSIYPTRLARFYPWQRYFIKLLTPFYLVRDTIKTLKFYWQNKDTIVDNFGKACELECMIGQVYSPFIKSYKK